MKSLYRNLALSGIKRNKNIFMPFIGTIIFLIVLNSICLSLVLDKSLAGASGMDTMKIFLFYGVIVLSIFSLIMLSSVYSFIQKRKLKEQGLYLILGLEKRHLRIILFWEIIYIIIFSIVPASIFSLVLYKLSLGIFVKLTNISINIFEGGFFNNILAVAIIALIFIAILIFVFAIQIIKMRNYSPIDLVNESKAGEKKNKFTKLIALLGIIFIASGYAISITTKNPREVFFKFFLAVLLVIIGTYCAFSVIVSLILEIIKNKKDLYYKKDNFFAISGLLYRVKNNSRSLASIAILSTAFTVVLTSGISLYVGIDDVVNRLFPSDYTLEIEDNSIRINNLEEYRNKVNKYLDENGFNAKPFTTMEWNVPLLKTESGVESLKSEDIDEAAFKNNLVDLQVIYTRDGNLKFGDADVLYFENEGTKDWIQELDFKVKSISEEENDVPIENVITIFEKNKIFVKDYRIAEEIIKKYEVKNSNIFSIEPSVKTVINVVNEENFAESLKENIDKLKVSENQKIKVIDRGETKLEFLRMYGVIFFVGLILSLAFLVTMGLSIYYKELTEGYEDVERFRILKKLGLGDIEAERSIKKQMATLLFLPIIFCIVHTAFAFPSLKNMLIIIGLMNIELFIKSMIFVILIYIIIYLGIYKFTEKVYAKIVLEK
ncbi:FtsX-like permease family protein [Peptoniphilus senegalensis]|uniref:FtsX-like permease family protein n=1 Tax=Peptoniphilus senegalensis TaxID=1465757 RepID=UPI0002F9BC43|nr:FtsX-like permease family protein [Peptoniphilus senegalensis]